MKFDYSTFDLDRLRSLPVAKLAPTYHLQEASCPGSGCYLDAPGFPTYFTRSVYTRYGNSPSRGATLVITDPEDSSKHYVIERAERRPGETYEQRYAKRQILLNGLYRPLPFDHPRVQAWVAALFRHFQHSYVDVDRPEYGKPGTLIYPVPAYKLKTYVDDPRFSDDYREAAVREVNAFNTQERNRALQLATVSNHRAARAVREIYPEFAAMVPEGDVFNLEDHWSRQPSTGDWWEVYAERPTPETCTPRRPKSWGAGARHNTEGWCQNCGYTPAEVAV